jgi:hypothetical protein
MCVEFCVQVVFEHFSTEGMKVSKLSVFCCLNLSKIEMVSTNISAILLLLLFLWGPSSYASGSTSALWLIVLSPVLDLPTFFTSSALPRPLSKESWSCNPVI